MDRVSRLRTGAGSASDESGANDTGFQTADDTASGSTKYLSFSEGDSCTPKKGGDVALGESTPRADTVDAGFGAGLSPIVQSGDDIVYGIGGQIDASNILSGGVDIFDDYNSNDGDGLVIDDDAANVSEDAESGADDKASRGTEKVICEPIESANLSLSADATLTLKEISESQLVEAEGAREECLARADEAPGNNEVILQIDGKNVDALDIGNGLYLYRKVEGEELNAIQILQEEGQAPHFKFLKVRQIGDSNLEVYEEHILEVPITNEELEEERRKEKIEGIHGLSQKSPHLPISDVKKAFVHENPASGKTVALNAISLPKEDQALKLAAPVETKPNSGGNDEKVEGNADSKLKPLKNLEGSRKSPILGNFTSMTLHSSPNREGALPTKTKIHLPLKSSRHSDTVKKTIEVSTDNSNLKCNEKTTISNVLPPKIDATGAPAPQLSDETKGVVKELLFKSDDATGNSASHIKLIDDKPVFDNHHDKGLARFENTNKIQSSVKTSKHDIVNNSDAILLSKKKTDGQSNTGSSDDTILAESKKTTDNKSNIAGKPIDMKKDVQTNKSNVVSKWVLRSDSIEEKCKKERDKMPVEIKPVSTFSTKVPANDISVENSAKDVEIKHRNIEMPNTSISKDKTKEECKGVKEVSKPTPEIKTQQENNASQHILGETSKTFPKLNVTEEDKKSQKVNTDQKHADLQSITEEKTSGKSSLVVDEKNVKTEKANNSEFVSKYISEAFKNIPTRPMAIASSTENTRNKLVDGKFKTKPVEILPAPVAAKTTNYQAPLRIDVETVSKPVPFGKWTEGDKQEYLNKLKDQKLPSTNPGLSPAKSYQLASTKNDIKRLELKKKADTFERVHLSTVPTAGLPDKPDDKNDDVHMKGLIDKTIEGMIMETLLGSAAKPPVMNPPTRSLPVTEDTDSEDSYEDLERKMNELHGIPLKEKHAPSLYSSVKGTLGTIGSTSKGNEKSVPRTETSLSHSKTPSLTKGVKMPKLLPLSSSGSNKIETNITKPLPKSVNASKVVDEDSDEEIIDCEPVTGDMQWPSQNTKDNQKVTVAAVQKMIAASASKVKDNGSSNKLADKKPGITEIEFDKFVRRNSTNQMTSNNNMTSEVENKKVQLTTQAPFESDTKYKPTKSLNQQIPERTLSTNINLKTSQPSLGVARSLTSHIHQQIPERTLSTNINLKTSQPSLGVPRSLTSHIPQSVNLSKSASRDSFNLYSVQSDGASNINYHTKLQMAYQSALSAKNQKEPPVKIVDEKPLKTAFLSSNVELISTAQNLSTVKRIIQSANYVESVNATVSQVISANDEVKPSDQTIVKSKHQRKQVLTPVESPPIEIVEPSDHIDDFGHKKRRKLEPKVQRSESGLQNNVANKDFKSMAPKKNYLLGRASSVAEETKKDESSAIINKTLSEVSSDEKTTNKPVEPVIEVPNTPKRGRGRPRKYPIQDASEVPHKNITPKTSKSSESDSQDQHSSIASVDMEDNDSDEEGIIRENWTMGKIDEKIVCPICNKLFRSENIVFKHVKHCSSLLKSPSKRSCTTFDMGSSPKRGKTEISMAEEPCNTEPIKNQPIYAEPAKHVPDSNEATDSQTLSDIKSNSVIIIDSPIPTTAQKVIVIEDSPAPTVDQVIKDNETMGKPKQTSSVDTTKSEPAPSRPKVNKVGRPRSTAQHTCEICGKTFRQLSYLSHHRSLHNKEPPKPETSDKPLIENKAMLSCEVCGKDFRKLHHLVEHREIHTTSTAAATAPQRKVSIEQKKDADTSPKSSPKKTDDHPAGFRCEPCDKSFRKLHHLVEHRETHDGVNRQKNTLSQPAPADKPTSDSPTCEVCGKSFRKLHHLIEHREQHTEAHQIEKKEKKSTLLAKDIIHECSLCYMVFPNEPSLNKHFGNCQKKKKTPAAGPSTEGAQAEEESEAELAAEVVLSEPEEIAPQTEPEVLAALPPPAPSTPPVSSPAPAPVVTKRHSKDIFQTDVVPAVPEKIEKSESEIPKTPKNKTPKPAKIGATVTKVAKVGVTVKKPAKIGATVTKRSRLSLAPLPEGGDNLEGNWKDSDDDSRYMINPSYRPESDEEREIFLNICVGKRNSLQFDSPSAKADFKRRRTSLQHPAKSQRLTPKNVEKLSKPPNVPSEENPTITQKAKPIKLQNKRSSSAVPSNSSLGDDNDVKYSFPKNAKTQKFQSKSGIPAPKNQTSKPVSEERSVRKTEKRKSLTGIAKRKSLGKNVAMKPKLNITKTEPTTIPAAPKKDVKNQARHVCDCGAPFSSVTLLAQHTSVAHTPPRIRRARLPEPPAPPPASRNKHKLVKHSGVPVAINKMRDTDK